MKIVYSDDEKLLFYINIYREYYNTVVYRCTDKDLVFKLRKTSKCTFL